MILDFTIMLFHNHKLETRNEIYSKAEMVAYVRNIVPTANAESIARAHRRLNEHGKIRYACISAPDAMYKAYPLKGEAKVLAVLELEDA